MVWLAFLLMAAAAAACASWPLLRPRRDRAENATDVSFYRDQIRELDGDVDRGLVRAGDAEATRAELGRRLIGAADRAGEKPPAVRRRAAVAAAAAAFVVLGGSGLYARVGRPGQPDAPLAGRAEAGNDIASALAKIEAHLAADPDDGRGYEVVAPVYMRAGRFADAARAYRGAIRTLGSTGERQSSLGQALMLAADGVVTAEARQSFDAALAADPASPQARFFEGVAALQDGDRAKARATWAAIAAEAPPGAPYAPLVRARIAEIDEARAEPAPAGLPPGADAVAALPAGPQRAAIQGMVDGLAARLAQDGRDGPGWLKLVRAYRVLGEGDRAAGALADARRAMASDPSALGQLDALAHELGLES